MLKPLVLGLLVGLGESIFTYLAYKPFSPAKLVKTYFLFKVFVVYAPMCVDLLVVARVRKYYLLTWKWPRYGWEDNLCCGLMLLGFSLSVILFLFIPFFRYAKSMR